MPTRPPLHTTMGVVVSSRRRRDPISHALGITLPPPFRQSIEDVRLTLDGREQALFDLLCVAGHLGRSLPNSIGNRRTTWGARDPRRKLARVAARIESGNAQEWKATSARLVLRVLLGNASIALAPDCHVPTDPVLLIAWKTVVALFARLYRSTIRPLGRLQWLDDSTLARLKRETVRGRTRGRYASGMRPGPAGRALAVDPKLMKAVGKALGLSVAPGYEARYNFHAREPMRRGERMTMLSITVNAV